MILERNNAPCSAGDNVSDGDTAKRNQSTAASLCASFYQVVDAALVLSTKDKKPDRPSCCSDSATAECSVSSGDSFAIGMLHEVSSRDDTSNKANRSQRGILRAESKISSEPQEKPQRTRKVQFGTVLVRDYEIILGDHPCCSYGPPITIDWDYLENEPTDVDVYEFENALARRTLRQLSLNYYQRKYLLRDCTDSELKAVKREINRIKLHRDLSRKLARYHAVEVALDSACRKFKRMTLKK
ncbi:hypothetical protein ACHAXR_009403 [Thalassiosira sp. AJA248-18]